MRAWGALLALTALSACASAGPSRQLEKRIDRALAGAPGEAQPSKIVAAEIAWARAAREQGQWTSFEAFAAPGALLHSTAGLIVAAPWLAAQKNPAEPVRWRPRAVWMSCDATMAVSEGRFRDPAGDVGSYMTAWARQADGSYKWTYDVAARDNPQPTKRSDLPEAEGDEIVVMALEAIQGRVADCPSVGEPVGSIDPLIGAVGVRSEVSLASDKTFQWSWSHEAPGIRSVRVSYWKEGVWQTVLQKSFPIDDAVSSGAVQ